MREDEHCECCEHYRPENSEPIDYNVITPEKAAEMLSRLDKLPAPWIGKSHYTLLMARKNGETVRVVKLSEVMPEDLSGLPVRV